MSPVSFFKPQTYQQFKGSRLWNHENIDLKTNGFGVYVAQVPQENIVGDMWSVSQDIESGELVIDLLNEALGLLESGGDTSNLVQLAEQLKQLDKNRTVLDLQAFLPDQTKKFYLNNTVVLRTAADIENRIKWVQREQVSLTELFSLLAENAEPDLRTKRFVDEATIHLKPFPEKITLLTFMIRRKRLDLLRVLVESPQIKSGLHLEYVVMLLDEVELLPIELRRDYRELVRLAFSPTALEEYNSGKRGVNATLWDKIPLGTY